MKKIVMAALTGMALLPVMEVMAQGCPPPCDPYKGTTGGVRLAADIVDLVGSIFAPRTVVVAPAPQPVVVQQPVVIQQPATIVVQEPVVVQQPVVTTTVVQQPVTTTTTTVIQQPTTTVVVQQPATIVVPTYTYAYYNRVYVPYYAGWYFYSGRWCWGRPGPPPRPPQWHPNPGPAPHGGGGPHGGGYRR